VERVVRKQTPSNVLEKHVLAGSVFKVLVIASQECMIDKSSR
jgi:hypothetical protein